MPRARCCSTSTAAASTTSFSPSSTCRAPCCRRSGTAPTTFGTTEPALFGGAIADSRRRRRPAGGDHRPGLLRARHDEIDLRHRLLRPAQYRPPEPVISRNRLLTTIAYQLERQAHLCARRLDLRRRRRRAMAARRPRHHPPMPARPPRWPPPPIPTRRSISCRPSSGSARRIGMPRPAAPSSA